MKIVLLKTVENVIVKVIFATIFLQQVLVLNVGGSFKIYEFAAMALLFLSLVQGPKIYGKSSILFFLLFVVVPVVSLFVYFVSIDVEGYFERFPEADENLRFNYNIIPLVVLIYYIINWVVINHIFGSLWVFKNRVRLVRIFVLSGTLISFYSLYGLFFVYLLGFPDVVPDFFDFRNSRPDFQMRPAGFSAEPSSYVIMLTWVLLFLIFIKDVYSAKLRYLLIAVNGSVFFLTLSSSILAVVVSFVLYLVLSRGLVAKIKYTFVFLFISMIMLPILNEVAGSDFVLYTFRDKIVELFQYPTTLETSGQFRSYTSVLGLLVFKDYPFFGVGGGNSYYFLHAYESLLQIAHYNFSLTHSVAPMNGYSKVLSELGIFGFLMLIAALSHSLYVFYKNRHLGQFFAVGFVGTLSTFGFLFAVYPIYSLFLWVCIALCLNSGRFVSLK